MVYNQKYVLCTCDQTYLGARLFLCDFWFQSKSPLSSLRCGLRAIRIPAHEQKEKLLVRRVEQGGRGEEEWRSAANTHNPPMRPGFDSRTRRHMRVEFVVGSRPCSEKFFSVYSCFLSPQKPTFPNSNSIWIIVKHFIMNLWLGRLRNYSLCY